MMLWLLMAPLMAADTPLVAVLSVHAPEPVHFAATELCRHIEEASGVAVRMEHSETIQEDHAVVLGFSERPDRTNLRVPASIHDEAYRIHALAGGGRAFTGNSPRAVLYAVYDFLETELGFRWYFPYPEDALRPKIERDVLVARLQQPVDREVQPAYAFREREFRDVAPMTANTDDRIVWQIDWWAKLRMNRFLLNFNYARDASLWRRWRKRLIPEIKRRGILVGLGEHGSYPLFLPPERYAAEHPDWYCEINGERIGEMRTPSGEEAQFCTTNPDAVAQYLDNFAAFMREHPEVDFYYPAPNDVGRWCECSQCSPLSIADRYLELNNQIAERLNQIKPGTRIMHPAYSNHRLPPEHTLPHPMIDIDIACWGRDFSYALCDPRTMPEDPEFLDVFKRWAELCRQLPESGRPRVLYHWKIMRHYWLGLQLLPLPIIDEDSQCISNLGLDGFDLPLGYLGIWTKALNAYVVAQKTWNPELSAEALIERFMDDYYGEQADAAFEIYRLAAEAFNDRRYGRSLTLAWFPDTSRVRETPLDGLGANARRAIACLDNALVLTKRLMDAPPPVAERARKLDAVLRQAREEQHVLEALDGLMRACHLFRQENTEDARQAAIEAWEAAAAANDHLAKRYSLEEDEAGLYWGGASFRQLGDALAQWRETLEPRDWRRVGDWNTEDFDDSMAPITKDFDVTALLAEMLPGTVHVRFQYTGGELGASLRAASLWERDGTGRETLLAKDRHSGFAGYIHENAVYQLECAAFLESGTRMILRTELAAYAATGNVAQRGCQGDILLGLPMK